VGGWTCFVLAVALTTATGCTSSLKTTSDWDHQMDFSRFHTFNFEQGMPFQTKNNEKYVREMVAVVLVGKGFVQVADNEKADFNVFLYPRLQYAGRVDWYTTGYTPWWGGWGGYVGVAATYTDIPVGGLLVDLVDNKNDRLIWRSTASAVLDEDTVHDAHLVMKAIEDMLKGFPPTVSK